MRWGWSCCRARGPCQCDSLLAKGDIQDSEVVIVVFDAWCRYTACNRGLALGAGWKAAAADIGRDSVTVVVFGLAPDQTGQIAPLTVGIEESGV